MKQEREQTTNRLPADLEGELKGAAHIAEQPVSKQKERTEVIVATIEGRELILMVGNERIPISGYNTKSIGGGLTEINVTIIGETAFTELSTISKK